MIRKKSTLFALLSLSLIFVFFCMLDSGAQVSRIADKAAIKGASSSTTGVKSAIVKFDKAPGMATAVGKGDNDVGSKKGNRTQWILKVKLVEKNKDTSGKFTGITANYTFTVKEDKKDYTHLEQSGSTVLPINFKFSKLEGQIEQTVSGYVDGQSHALVGVSVPSNNLINDLSVKIDSNKSDDRSEINFSGNLKISYTE